jgi:toxin-antitoxin system PIN domain toxin
MPTHLLDVNVLLALAWPNHEHYRVASKWFARQGRNGWATCPITQCAFVRISSNPKIFNFAVSLVQATEMLREICRHPAHVFWPDDLEFTDGKYIAHGKITGHRQITDAYLLALAIRHGGVLATIDQGIASLAEDIQARENLFIIGNKS